VSIRTRLAIAVALVLVGTFALIGVVLVRSTRATLVDQLDDQIAASAARNNGPDHPPWEKTNDKGRGYSDGPPPAQTDYLASSASTDDESERSVALFVYGEDGEVIVDKPCGFPDARKPPPRLPTIPSQEIDKLVNRIVTMPAVDGSLDYRLLVQRGPNHEYVISAASLESVDAAVSRLIRIFLVVGAVALAAATLAAWWLIRRGLRPVDRMIDTAAAIAAGDLSRRVPDAEPRTELGRLGGALNEMLHQIEGAVRSRTASEERLRRFIADAAHELRTPLTSLRGYAELYRQGAIPDETGVANAMRRIESEGARMARLVDDMLLLARLDQQRGLETKPIDVVALVREAVADFRVVAPDRAVTEDLTDAAIVKGDRIRLRQVVDNLLANARIHTPPGTPVHVTVTRGANDVEVAIADDGPGIPAADQARVFERFWRADPARVRSRGGTGLGLAIVASLVEAQGGRVGVTSEPGRGATFTVRLPLITDANAASGTTGGDRPAVEPKE
jgi:two-component system, OmpR family, sensor kinase